VKRLAAVVAVLVSVFLVTTAPASAGNGDVVVIGNSLLGQSNDELRPKLSANGWLPHIEWVNGSGLTVGAQTFTPYEWQTELAQLELDYDPKVVVIELGTNDALWVAAGEPYPPHIARLLSATDAPRVLWLKGATHTAVIGRNQGCSIINADGAATEREGFEVVDYDGTVASNPANIRTDSVHLTAAGQEAFAQLVADRVGPK